MRTVPAYALLAAIAFLPSTAFAQEWSGPYGVVSIADDGGSTESFGGGTPIATYGRNGQQGSIAFGYNVQNGNWVIGGELAYSTGQIGLSVRPDLNYLDGMIDLKGRAGYATGQVLWYGTIGWARSEQYFLSPLVTNEPVGTAGMSIGLGVDALLTDRVFVGLEYQQRRLDIEEGEMGGFPSVSYKNTVDSVALRVGLTF